MALATFDPVSIQSAKLRSLGVSDLAFSKILGISATTVSRWFSGQAKPSTEQLQHLKETVNATDRLFALLHPVKPDMSADNARTLVELVKTKRLWAHVQTINYEQAFNKTREEIERAEMRFRAGVEALASQVFEEQKNGNNDRPTNSEVS